MRSQSASLLALGVVLCVTLVWPTPVARSAEDGAFREVDRLPLTHNVEDPGGNYLNKGGWLILDPATRRGYQLFEAQIGIELRTVIQSFDLDTLRPLRRAELSGIPVTGGAGDVSTVGVTSFAGEVVHAVDQDHHRIYLAMNEDGALEGLARKQLVVNNSADSQRPLSRLVAIDEDAFDECAGVRDDCEWAASFREPDLQARLHHYFLLGMTVSRHHVEKGEPGRLVALFARPTPGSIHGSIVGVVPYYDHTVVQWDMSGIEFSSEAPMATNPDLLGVDVAITKELATQAVSGEERRLDLCTAGSVAAIGAEGHSSYQWGLLVTRDAIWTACQAAGVVRVSLDDAGRFQATGDQERFPLAQKLADVLVDEGGGRLLVKSWGNGESWWVFDTRLRRFTGSITAQLGDNGSLAAGIHPTTGRLYQLSQDSYAIQDGRDVPTRGGLLVTDSRIDPIAPLENIRPDLAHPAAFAIRVDPKTNRVFVRRGHPSRFATPVYPKTQPETFVGSEGFYRVFEDRMAVTEAPPPPDDSLFTTDVDEDPDLTRASYLGTGAGYGVRTLLVGGLHAAANRTPVVGDPNSPCGREDREITSGEVGQVEVSDLSTTANASSLDADGKSRDDLDEPVHHCTPPALAEQLPPGAETNEAGFDDDTKATEGENLYRAECVGEEDEVVRDEASAPGDSRVVSRRRFRSGATCDHAGGKAEASAEGAFASPELDAAQLDAAQDEARKAGADVPTEHVTVGHAASEVSVVRTAGEGIVVKVDSIARNVVIPGVGTIGLVRGEATSTATGRPGGAGSRYERTICAIDFPSVKVADCLDEKEQSGLEERMNQDLQGRGRIRFRPADPILYEGSPSGYKSGVQRPTTDAFEDANVARDVSAVLPAMELVLYSGDSPSEGPGRQFFQFAGVQAGASYGISCLYGLRSDGACTDPDDPFDDGGGTVTVTTREDGTEVITITEPGSTEYVQGPAAPAPKAKRSILERIVRFPAEVLADVLRLLFANPREFALMAAVWALLYAPCYLGERRRSIAGLRARRAALG